MSGDTLRDEIAAAFAGQRIGLEWDDLEGEEQDEYRTLADAVLPIVQARIAVEREQVAHEAWQQGYAAGKEQAAEQIAQAIEAEYVDSPWIRRATDIARQHAKGDGDGQP